ncbi:MAG: pirin family protein [Candidatus Berkiellales bacterium]
MSDLIPKCQLSDSKDSPPCSLKPIHQMLKTRDAQLGNNLTIRRALPHRDRRMIGAWCFLDHFGPLNLKQSQGLNIGPHPHIGLQTLTWLVEGKILHRDSLGSEQVITPGQVNLMTAGKGISHSEESLVDHLETLHGVQLWIALPDQERHIDPIFSHYPYLPVLQLNGLVVTLFAGELLGERASTKTYTPLVGLDVHTMKETEGSIPLNPLFEYGVLLISERAEVEGEDLTIDSLLYLGCGRTELKIRAPKNAHLIIVGGKPFDEEILIWWNFVARSKAEMEQATTAWQTSDYFGEVKGYQGDRLVAPTIPWSSK